jgi:hypothetical protein
VDEAKKHLEQETRVKIEEEAKKRVEEAKKEIEAAIRKEHSESLKQKNEELERKLETLKKIEETQKPVDITAIKEKLREELRAEMQEGDKNRQQEALQKIKQAQEEAKKQKEAQEQALRDRMKEQIQRDMEEEKEKKKKEMMEKVAPAIAEPAAPAEKLGEAKLSQEEKVMLASMLEESMSLLVLFFSARTGKVKSDFIKLSIRSLVDAARKDPDYLKKALIDAGGGLLNDGTFDKLKLVTLANGVSFDEAKRAEKLCHVMKLIFEERLAAIEQISSPAIKAKIMNDFTTSVRKITGNPKYNRRVEALFLNYVVPK